MYNVLVQEGILNLLDTYTRSRSFRRAKRDHALLHNFYLLIGPTRQNR